MDALTENRIIDAIGAIATLPYAFVDRGVGQGRQVILDSLSPRPEAMKAAFRPHPQYAWLADETLEQRADRIVAGIRAYLDELDMWLLPQRLPDDYRFFIEFYGGLKISTVRYYLNVFGYGLNATNEYDIPMDGKESLYEQGWLAFSVLVLKDKASILYGKRVYFCLDLRGNLHQGCVISLPTWGHFETIRDPRVILRDVDTYRECWTKIADSFTDWLELVARTRGTLDYMQALEQ